VFRSGIATRFQYREAVSYSPFYTKMANTELLVYIMKSLSKVTYASSVSLHHTYPAESTRMVSMFHPDYLPFATSHCANSSSDGCLSPISVRLSQARRIIWQRGESTAQGAQRSGIGTQRSRFCSGPAVRGPAGTDGTALLQASREMIGSLNLHRFLELAPYEAGSN
jgi:hypothetical protein